jgi:hypothetical protein
LNWIRSETLTTIKTEHTLQFPTQVRLRSQLVGDTGRGHVAVLSYNPACPVNYIRHEFVTNYLGEKIHAIVDKDDITNAQALSHEGVKGYVELEWCLESNEQLWHQAHFLVTTTTDPAYDIVLGSRDWEKLGMGKTSSNR